MEQGLDSILIKLSFFVAEHQFQIELRPGMHGARAPHFGLVRALRHGRMTSSEVRPTRHRARREFSRMRVWITAVVVRGRVSSLPIVSGVFRENTPHLRTGRVVGRGLITISVRSSEFIFRLGLPLPPSSLSGPRRVRRERAGATG